MKKRVLIAPVVTGALVLALLLVPAVGANPTYVLLDSVDVGDTGSESTHSLAGWGPIEPLTHPGGWGGATSGSSRCRTVYYSDLDGDKPCEYGDEPWAEVTLDAGSGVAKSLVIGHLDGSADDSFDVYANGVHVGHHTGDLDGEHWKQSTYPLPDLVGLITVKIVVSNPGWTYFCYWGHLGIDWIELWGEPDTDADGVIDINDNCPLTANPGQEDNDLDGSGDVCDDDDDNDGIPDASDECSFEPETLNGVQDDDGCPDIAVTIDIKPGSDPNAINLGANGVIPVAIFGSPDLDVTEIDFSTVSLKGAEVRVKGKSGNYGSFDDLDLDGYVDVVIQVYNDMSGVLEGTATATLTGNLNDGTPIEGSDEIVVVPPK